MEAATYALMQAEAEEKKIRTEYNAQIDGQNPEVRETMALLDKARYDLEQTVLIQEWNLNAANGETRPAMEMSGMLPNFFTLNGKSYPATETVKMHVGQKALFRLIGAGSFSHPMHLHGTDFTVVAKDGHPLRSPFKADVIQVGSGERYDIVFSPTRSGKWVFHCHIGHHLTNDGDDPGGLLLVVDVT